MPDCDCNQFPENERLMWCERHHCWKTRNWVKLCQTRADYRKAWDEGRGPGQTRTDVDKPSQPRKPRVKGVGDHMKDLTAALKLSPKQGCGCQSLANEMNRLGPDGCRRERTRLVGKLETNAQRYSWGDVATAVANAAKNAAVAAVHLERVWIPNPLDPYGSMLDEAIRRTEATPS